MLNRSCNTCANPKAFLLLPLVVFHGLIIDQLCPIPLYQSCALSTFFQGFARLFSLFFRYLAYRIFLCAIFSPFRFQFKVRTALLRTFHKKNDVNLAHSPAFRYTIVFLRCGRFAIKLPKTAAFYGICSGKIAQSR